MELRGMTLIEMIVTVALTGIVGVTLAILIGQFYRSNAYLLDSTSAVDSASRGLRETLAIMRESSYGEDGSYPIASAATSSIQFYSDTDGDSNIEKIRFYLLNSVLYKGTTNPGGNPPSYTGQTEQVVRISSYVTNASSTPLFTYYDANGTQLTGTIDPSSVRAVKVSLTVDIDPKRAPQIVLFEGTATLRNVRDE